MSNITPPPELLQLWFEQHHDYNKGINELLIEAAQYGADQELRAVCQLLFSDPSVSYTLSDIRAARRPKPPSLNSIALQMLGTIERDAHYLPEITDTIRRALNQLSDS